MALPSHVPVGAGAVFASATAGAGAAASFRGLLPFFFFAMVRAINDGRFCSRDGDGMAGYVVQVGWLAGDGSGEKMKGVAGDARWRGPTNDERIIKRQNDTIEIFCVCNIAVCFADCRLPNQADLPDTVYVYLGTVDTSLLKIRPGRGLLCCSHRSFSLD